jgi:hypothetical protein
MMSSRSRSGDVLCGGAATHPAAATVGRVIGASGAGGRARAARGAQAESTQVNRAGGSKRAHRAGPFKLPARGAQVLSGGKWPGAGRRGKLTEQRFPAAKHRRRGEANGQLFGLWLHDL